MHQMGNTQNEALDRIAAAATTKLPGLTEVRRSLHRHPEAGWMEFRTTGIVADQLRKLGYDVKLGSECIRSAAVLGRPPAAVLEQSRRAAGQVGSGIEVPGAVGILDRGPGPTVALRFDMDATEVSECADESHRPCREGFAADEPNVMHACGHDAHVAIGLGAAELLAECPDWRGRLKFLFQPAEEGGRGAYPMVEAGVVDDVDYFVSLHLGGPDLRLGEVALEATHFLSSAKLDARFRGVASHAAGAPEKGRNALLAERGFRTDMAVLPEPFGLGNLVTVHAGIVHLAIHTYGVTGHISRIDDTVNAVQQMTRVIDELENVRFTYNPRADLPALPRLNVGSIIGGRGESYILTEPPYVPDLCTIIVDVHFVPGQSAESVVADIRSNLDALQQKTPQLKYEIEIPPPDFFKGRRRLVMDPLDVPRDAEVVQAVARNHQRVTGAAPNLIGACLPMSYSAGDSCWLWKAGIPCLHYGPGGGFLDPGPDGSYILISEMTQCAEVLAMTAVDVCGSG